MSILKSGKITQDEAIIIKRLRTENKSYGYISEVINCKKARVKSWCQSNNLEGYKGDGHTNPDNKLNVFLNNLNRKTDGGFVYVSGYKNCDSDVVIRCLKCGEVSIKNAQFVRKDKLLRCGVCIERKRYILAFTNRIQRDVNNNVKGLIKCLRKRIEMQKKDIERAKSCIWCGEVYQCEHLQSKYCSVACKNKARNKQGELYKRNRIYKNGLVDKDISLVKLISKHKGVCYLCNEQVDTLDCCYDSDGNFITGNMYPSIEHVIPISKGGTHTWGNVNLAHRICNTLKGSKIDD